jgi:hypothetical protein
MKPKRIYFAGKIGDRDWRSKLFGYRPAGLSDDFAETLFNPSHVEDMGGGLLYGGPFFVSCDHGCAHGPSSHGVGAGGPPFDDADKGEPWIGGCSPVTKPSGQPYTKFDIFSVNNARIQRAHWVFAFIDDLTAYGTLMEIGFAYAHAIPIALAFSDTLIFEMNTAPEEFWYAQQAATQIYCGSPQTTFAAFCEHIGIQWNADHLAGDAA